MGVGQTADQNRVDHREDRHVEPYAQPQRRDGQDHEGAVAGQATEGVAQVAGDVVEPPRASGVAAQLLDLVEAAELQTGAPARFTRGHAGPEVVGHLPLDVVAQLGVQLGLCPVAAPQPLQRLPPAHGAPPPAVPRIRPTASASRAQLSVSACNCARPLAVSR